MTSPDSREEAWGLLCEYTKSENLRKHGLAVEAAMRHYAELLGGDIDVWGMAGLLHDFDYEKYPSLEDHPYKGQKILKDRGYSEELREIIMGHAPHTGTERNTLAKKAIFAVDELSGFIVGVALTRPNKKLSEVEVKSIEKKMKQKGFCAAVSRDDIKLGAEELELTLDEHIEHVLKAMRGISVELAL